MKIYELVADQLRHEGTEAVFGLMGDGNLKLITDLTHRLGTPFYGARHETGAIAMADAYARTSGRVGVCTVTKGPGLTNALTGLVTARRARTPLVFVAGDSPTHEHGDPSDIDQISLFGYADIPVQDVDRSSARSSVASAFLRARTESRPIALNLPTDVQAIETASEDLPQATATERDRTAPSESALASAAEAIAAAQRPVIVAGRGAMLSGAAAEIVALADRVGALLATSLPARDLFRDQPFNIGAAGGYANDLTMRLASQADCIVAIGASLNKFTSHRGALFASNPRVIHIDDDMSALDRFQPADVHVVGDARLTATLLAERVSPKVGYRTAAICEEIETHQDTVDDASDQEGIDPRTLSLELARMTPTNRTLTVDGGHFTGFPTRYISAPSPSHFVFTLDFGSVGLGLSAGIGAAIARPDSYAITAVGDGGLMMALSELDTAVRYQIPLLVVVYNDRAYGAEVQYMRHLQMPEDEAHFQTPPLDAVARAIGARGHCVRTLDDLRALAPELSSLRGPTLIDCRISGNVPGPWLKDIFRTLN